MRRVPLTQRQRVTYATVAAAVWLLVTWLDSDGCVLRAHHTIPVQQADVFTAIWAALQAIGSALGTAAAATVAYLAQALAWLAGHVAGILRSTGAMFAKVWDGVKIVWSDVLKPTLQWVDARLKQLHDWLTRTFAPVFKFLRRVHDEIQSIYKRFVKPVVDTIEFVRAINRVLVTFHIKLLQQLDAVLAQVEQRIEEPFLWVNQQLTRIWNVLDDVVTLDGFFRRVTLIRSMARYAPDWMRVAVNARSRDLSGGEAAQLTRAGVTQNAADITDDIAAYWRGEQNDVGAVIEAGAERMAQQLNELISSALS